MNLDKNADNGKDKDTNKLLEGLNAEQARAVQTIEGPLLILAGAGSGKTKTITHRLAYMIKRGVNARQILAVSFTNKAAQEMKERIHQLMGTTRFSGPSVSTFHAFASNLLRQEIHHLGYHPKFTIYDTSDTLALIRELLKNYKDGKNYDIKTLQGKISFLKNRAITPELFPKSAFFDTENDYDVMLESLYYVYQERLKFYNAVDFDDILYLTLQLFNEREELKMKYSKEYRYIMVDEYQDTNSLQFQLLRCLTVSHNNLCVVGDDDQSIYAFRGADITNILSFEKHFPGATIIKLEQNYRSTASIVQLAGAVMKSAKGRREKNPWSARESLIRPKIWACASTEGEALEVVESIRQKHKKEGIPLKEMAIIYRSNNQAQIFEETLRLNNINYTLIGGQKFYDKKEIKDLLSYLAAIFNHYDEVAIRRIINTPSRGIGQTTLKKVTEQGSIRKKPFYTTLESFLFEGHIPLKDSTKKSIASFMIFLKEMREYFFTHPIHESITHLVEKLNFVEFIEKSYDNPKQQLRRKKDLEVFIYSAKRFHEFNQHLGNHQDILRCFLEKIFLADMQDSSSKSTDEKEREEEEKNNEDAVTLLTIHSSKGLEFGHVYFVGLEEEIIPHKKTIKENIQNGTDDVDEERRLCYVGMTRAKDELIVTYCKKRFLYGKDMEKKRSRFLMGLDDLIQSENRADFSEMGQEQRSEFVKSAFEGLLKSLSS